MPRIANQSLRDAVRRFKIKQRFTNKDLGDLCDPGISSQVVGNFLNGSNPHEKNRLAFEDLMKNAGYFTASGLPTELMKPNDFGLIQEESPSPQEQSILEDMGIHSQGDRELDAMQDEWVLCQGIGAIMSADIPETSKKKLVKRIAPQQFPNIS